MARKLAAAPAAVEPDSEPVSELHNFGIKITGDAWRKIASRWKAKRREIDAHNVKGQELKADLKAIEDEAKELGVPKKKLREVLGDAMKTRGDLELEARLDAFLRKELSMPVVESVQGQLSLEPPNLDDVTVVSARWEDAGFTAGCMGEDPVAPRGCPPEYHQDWLRGRARGQESIAKRLGGEGEGTRERELEEA